MALRIKSLLLGSLFSNSANSLSTLKATTAVLCDLRSGLADLRDMDGSSADQSSLSYERTGRLSTLLPFCVAEDAIKDDIENIVHLLLNAGTLAEKIIGEHGAIE